MMSATEGESTTHLFISVQQVNISSASVVITNAELNAIKLRYKTKYIGIFNILY